MSTVTVHITQNVAIARPVPDADPISVQSAVASVITQDLATATGLDWSTLSVTVDSGA